MYNEDLKMFVGEMINAIQGVIKEKRELETLTREMSFFHRGQLDAWVVMLEQMEEYKE